MYYDVVVQVEPKRNALREATDTLNAANTKLAEVKELVQTLETNLAALILGGVGFQGLGESWAQHDSTSRLRMKGSLKRGNLCNMFFWKCSLVWDEGNGMVGRAVVGPN